MNNYDIIIAPIITEKTASMESVGKYAFKVKVESINTSNSHPKNRRVGKYTGKTNRYKKAIVKLVEGNTISFD